MDISIARHLRSATDDERQPRFGELQAGGMQNAEFSARPFRVRVQTNGDSIERMPRLDLRPPAAIDEPRHTWLRLLLSPTFESKPFEAGAVHWLERQRLLKTAF
jgi:hypothetical protein